MAYQRGRRSGTGIILTVDDRAWHEDIKRRQRALREVRNLSRKRIKHAYHRVKRATPRGKDSDNLDNARAGWFVSERKFRLRREGWRYSIGLGNSQRDWNTGARYPFILNYWRRLRTYRYATKAAKPFLVALERDVRRLLRRF